MTFTGWCQILNYLRSVWSFLSVWYVVSFTIERYIAGKFMDLFTSGESDSEREKYQRIRDKHQRNSRFHFDFLLV